VEVVVVLRPSASRERRAAEVARCGRRSISLIFADLGPGEPVHRRTLSRLELALSTTAHSGADRWSAP